MPIETFIQADPGAPGKDTFLGIPYVVWSAVIAAGISYLGVLYSGRNSRKQLSAQLNADADLRRIDREMSLRRDVYLPLAVAISRLQSSIAQVANVDEDSDSISENVNTDIATMARAHAVASQDLIDALMRFQTEALLAYISLQEMRGPMDQRRAEIEREEKFAGQLDSEVKVLLETMRRYRLEGETSDDRWANVRHLFDSAQDNLSQCANKVHRLNLEQQAARLRMGTHLSELMPKIASLVPPIVVLGRRELGLPVDGDRYMQSFMVQQEKMSAAIRGMSERYGPAIDQAIEALNQEPPKLD